MIFRLVWNIFYYCLSEKEVAFKTIDFLKLASVLRTSLLSVIV